MVGRDGLTPSLLAAPSLGDGTEGTILAIAPRYFRWAFYKTLDLVGRLSG